MSRHTCAIGYLEPDVKRNEYKSDFWGFESDLLDIYAQWCVIMDSSISHGFNRRPKEFKEESIMKGKKFLALLVSAALCFSMLAGCGSNDNGNDGSAGNNTVDDSQQDDTQDNGDEVETPTDETPEDTAPVVELSSDPVVRITQGYYSFTYPIDGMDDMCAFFHFYEEQPVLGSIFYAGYAWNQITFVGTYKVEEKETSYACVATREDMTAEPKVITEGTAPYTVTFYDLEGNELGACGFDGDILYNDTTAISGSGAEDCMFYLDAQGDASPYAATYAGELGKAIADYVAADEATSTLTLYHSGRYMDLVDMMIEGNWTMTGAGEYTLTPDSASDTAAVLTVNADGTATYVPEGGDAIAMVSTMAGPEVFYTMKGVLPMDGFDADLVLSLYVDNTCSLVASAYGTEFPLDAGTWVMGEDGFTITIQFDNAGEIVSILDGERFAAGVGIQYVQTGTMLGDIDADLGIVLE